MTWLFEQPLVIVVLGIVLLLGLGIAWSSTGRKELLYAAGLVLSLVVLGLVIERLVTTDAESIRQTLQEIAHDVKHNDHRSLVRHIADSAPEIRQRAEAEMPNYDFSECRVTRVHEIAVDGAANPKAAVVELNVVFSGDFRHEGLEVSDYTGARWVKLHLVQDKEGRWRIEDYEHDDPQRMIMERPAP
jgi:hypothetical protein